VRVTIKGKILQLTLPCEVSVDKSNVQRNTTTGSLMIAMARLIPCTTIVKKDESTIKKKSSESKTKVITIRPPVTSRRALLEIGPPTVVYNFLKITEDSAKQTQKKEKKNLEDFEDNSDVPPLE